jgi:hypothetical protein
LNAFDAPESRFCMFGRVDAGAQPRFLVLG